MSSMLFEELLPVLSLDEYEDNLPEKYRGICKLVKIRTVGWRNTNFVGVIGIILVDLFMWICDPPFTNTSDLPIGGPDSQIGRYD
jgi:hypothetical protein